VPLLGPAAFILTPTAVLLSGWKGDVLAPADAGQPGGALQAAGLSEAASVPPSTPVLPAGPWGTDSARAASRSRQET
jgi:hypothetical protein